MKHVNWGKWASVSFVATFGCYLAGEVWSHSTLGQIPGQVSDHERRIAVLESQNATNAVRLDDRLDRIEGDLKRIDRQLGELSGDAYSTNVAYLGEVAK